MDLGTICKPSISLVDRDQLQLFFFIPHCHVQNSRAVLGEADSLGVLAACFKLFGLQDEAEFL